jgi:hypothetical protein
MANRLDKPFYLYAIQTIFQWDDGLFSLITHFSQIFMRSRQPYHFDNFILCAIYAKIAHMIFTNGYMILPQRARGTYQWCWQDARLTQLGVKLMHGSFAIEFAQTAAAGRVTPQWEHRRRGCA